MSTSIRPEHLRLIDDALEKRQGLISLLDAVGHEFSWIASSKNVRHVVDALNRGVTTEEFLNDGILAAWLPLLMAGRDSSTRETQHELVLSMIKQESGRRRSHWLSLIYPIGLFSIVIVVLVLLSVSIIPKWRKIFSEFELKLPAPTLLVLGVSDVIVNRPILLIVVTFCSVGFAWLLYRVFPRSFQYLQLSHLFGSYFSGSTSNVISMYRFSGTLAEMLSLGAPLYDALLVAGIASQRVHFRVRSEQLAVETKNQIKTFEESAVAHNFPRTLIFALSAGAAGAPSVPLLRQLASIYGDRAQNRENLGTSFIGPLATLAIGLIVGFVVIALFMPLISLITSLS